MTHLTRRQFLPTLGLAGASLRADPKRDADFLARAEAFHQKHPVFLGYLNYSSEQFLAKGGRQCDLEKLDAAGVRTFVASIGFGCYFQTGPQEYSLAGPDEWVLEQQLKRIDDVAAAVRRSPRTRLITRAADLEPDKEGKIGVLIHLTGNNHTVNLGAVDTFFKKGVRASHPAMQYHDRWCMGHNGKPAPAITAFGRQVIRRMNELGIVIDTAHASDESATLMVQSSVKPVNDSHTTSRTRVPLSRGLSDKVLQQIAQSGGVVGVLIADQMLSTEAWRKKYSRAGRTSRLWAYNRWVLETTKDPDARMRLRRNAEAQAKFFEDHKLPPDVAYPRIRGADLADLAATIDYLVRLVGIDHVGLGSDINGIDDHQWPEGIDHTGQLPRMTAKLLELGWSEANLRKFLYENWQRSFRRGLPA